MIIEKKRKLGEIIFTTDDSIVDPDNIHKTIKSNNIYILYI